MKRPILCNSQLMRCLKSRMKIKMKQKIEIGRKGTLLEFLNKEIYDFCKDCSAWSGSDCTRNPYTEGCLKEAEDND